MRDYSSEPLTPEELAAYKPVPAGEHAARVHKAQGSEWDHGLGEIERRRGKSSEPLSVDRTTRHRPAPDLLGLEEWGNERYDKGFHAGRRQGRRDASNASEGFYVEREEEG